MLQWKTTDDPNAPYTQQVAISRIRNISRGCATPLLESAAAADRKGKRLIVDPLRLFMLQWMIKCV